jgi:hypothetical protein
MKPEREGTGEASLVGEKEVPATWHRLTIASETEGEAAVAAVLATLEGAGYQAELRQPLGELLREVVGKARACAIQEGRGKAILDYRVGVEEAIVEVEGVRAGVEGPPLQGPHDPELFRAALGAAGQAEQGPHSVSWFGPAGTATPSRSFTWVRLHRRAGRVEVCTYVSFP